MSVIPTQTPGYHAIAKLPARHPIVLNKPRYYIGIRWQPSVPRPPQPWRGVIVKFRRLSPSAAVLRLILIGIGRYETSVSKIDARPDSPTMIPTPSLCETIWATLAKFSWLSQFTGPKLVIWSPWCSPAASAGLPDATELIFAKGLFAVSMAIPGTFGVNPLC